MAIPVADVASVVVDLDLEGRVGVGAVGHLLRQPRCVGADEAVEPNVLRRPCRRLAGDERRVVGRETCDARVLRLPRRCLRSEAVRQRRVRIGAGLHLGRQPVGVDGDLGLEGGVGRLAFGGLGREGVGGLPLLPRRIPRQHHTVCPDDVNQLPSCVYSGFGGQGGGV